MNWQDLSREARARTFAGLVKELANAKEMSAKDCVPWCVVRARSTPGYISSPLDIARVHGYQPIIVIEPEEVRP